MLLERLPAKYRTLRPTPPYRMIEACVVADDRNLILAPRVIAEDANGVQWKLTSRNFVSDMQKWYRLPDKLDAVYKVDAGHLRNEYIKAESASQALQEFRTQFPWVKAEPRVAEVFLLEPSNG